MALTLRALIQFLEIQDPDLHVSFGFSTPHSYRMDYSQLAFTPASDVTIASMLDHARSAVGVSFQGWKGGNYHMDLDTECFIAEEGEPGRPVDALLLTLLRDEIHSLQSQVEQARSDGWLEGWRAARTQLIQNGILPIPTSPPQSVSNPLTPTP